MRLCIGALSCAKNEERRRCVLASWATDCSKFPITNLIFAVGGERSLHKNFTNCVLLPAPDDYHHLVFKSVENMRYAYDNNYDFFFKCDDDTYVCLERLWALISPQPTDTPLYLGREINRDKDGKGYGSGGAGYLLNRLAMSAFLKSYDADPFPKTRPDGKSRWCEDSKIGHRLKELGIFITNSTLLHTGLGTQPVPEPGNSLITGHYIKPTRMIETWKAFQPSAVITPKPPVQKPPVQKPAAPKPPVQKPPVQRPPQTTAPKPPAPKLPIGPVPGRPVPRPVVHPVKR